MLSHPAEEEEEALGAQQGLRNRCFSTGLLSHSAHRMDGFLGKYPSFVLKGGIVCGPRLCLLQALEGVGMEQLSVGLTGESERAALAFL